MISKPLCSFCFLFISHLLWVSLLALPEKKGKEQFPKRHFSHLIYEVKFPKNAEPHSCTVEWATVLTELLIVSQQFSLLLMHTSLSIFPLTMLFFMSIWVIYLVALAAIRPLGNHICLILHILESYSEGAYFISERQQLCRPLPSHFLSLMSSSKGCFDKRQAALFLWIFFSQALPSHDLTSSHYINSQILTLTVINKTSQHKIHPSPFYTADKMHLCAHPTQW